MHCHKSKTVSTARNGFPVLQMKTISMELLYWLTLLVIDQLIPVPALYWYCSTISKNLALLYLIRVCTLFLFDVS